MKIDQTDEAIIEAFQLDGRQSNREVARTLGVSEGTVRQRLKKLQDAGAIRFDVVSDSTVMGIDFVAFIRVSVQPKHLEDFLETATRISELWYLAAVAGRFNVIAVIATTSASNAMQIINSQVEGLTGVNEIDVRTVADSAKYDFYEIVVPRSRQNIT